MSPMHARTCYTWEGLLITENLKATSDFQILYFLSLGNEYSIQVA